MFINKQMLSVLENLQNAIKQLGNMKNNPEKITHLPKSSKRDKLYEIPKFYYSPQVLDDPLRLLVKKTAIERRIERVESLLLNSNDLQLVWSLLNSNSRLEQVIDGKIISFNEFKKITEDLPAKFKWLFKPEVFLRLPKTEQGDISIQMMFSYVTRAGTSTFLVEKNFDSNVLQFSHPTLGSCPSGSAVYIDKL